MAGQNGETEDGQLSFSDNDKANKYKTTNMPHIDSCN